MAGIQYAADRSLADKLASAEPDIVRSISQIKESKGDE